MKNKRNIYKVLLNNKRVNNYTKMLILLNTLDFYGDNYIPNKKLMNHLNIDKRRVKRLLHQLKEDNIINIIYNSRKRFFSFKDYEKEEYKETIEIENYNWLEDD